MRRRAFLGAVAAAAVARKLPAALSAPVPAVVASPVYAPLAPAFRSLWAVWMDPGGNIGVGRAAPPECVTLGVVEVIPETPNIRESASFHGDVRAVADAFEGGAPLFVRDDVPLVALAPVRFREAEITEPMRGGGPFGSFDGVMVTRGYMPSPPDLGAPIRFDVDGVPSL